MPTISPVSDLRNYGTVLDKVSTGTPVYLTRNGYGVYSIRSMEDEEKFIKTDAMLKLMCELNAGIYSGEQDGWLNESDVRDYMHTLRNRQL